MTECYDEPYTTPLHTPWGAAETVTTLTEGIDLVTTATHGGLRIYVQGRRLVPEPVANTFRNGPEWAEEDYELYIALMVAYRRMNGAQRSDIKQATANGILPEPAAMLAAAQETCREYDESYGICAPYLEPLDHTALVTVKFVREVADLVEPLLDAADEANDDADCADRRAERNRLRRIFNAADAILRYHRNSPAADRPELTPDSGSG